MTAFFMPKPEMMGIIAPLSAIIEILITYSALIFVAWQFVETIKQPRGNNRDHF